MTYIEGQLQHLHFETVKTRAMPSPKKAIKRTVRFPGDLIARIDAEADRNGRSFNAEIIAKLNDAYAQPSLEDLVRGQDELRQLVRSVLHELEALSLRK